MTIIIFESDTQLQFEINKFIVMENQFLRVILFPTEKSEMAKTSLKWLQWFFVENKDGSILKTGETYKLRFLPWTEMLRDWSKFPEIVEDFMI